MSRHPGLKGNRNHLCGHFPSCSFTSHLAWGDTQAQPWWDPVPPPQCRYPQRHVRTWLLLPHGPDGGGPPPAGPRLVAGGAKWGAGSEGAALGDNVTLRCHVPQPAARVLIYKEGDGTYQWYREKVEDTAEFSMKVSARGYAGRYWCLYETLEPSRTLEISDPVELVELASWYRPPTVALRPGGRLRTGTNVTIECQSLNGATFILHKAGRSAPIQRQAPDRRGTATFVLPRVTPSDAGTYGCSYRLREHPFISSHPRAEVTLEVEHGGPSTTSPLPPSPDLRPSLSLHPSEGAALGDNVTLRCHVPQPAARVLIYKEGDGTYQWYREKVEDTAEFSMKVSARGYAGRYWCQYETLEPSRTLEISDPVELVELASWYRPPTVALRPGGRLRTGTNVTIECQSLNGATFILHKAGRSAPIQRQAPDRRGTATFVLPRVTPSDAGTYGCSYRLREHPFISSHPRAEVTLEVEHGGPSTTSPLPPSPGAKGDSGWKLAVVGGCAATLVLILCFGLIFFTAALCRRRQRGKGPTMVAPSRDPVELLSQDVVDVSHHNLRPLQPLPQEDTEGLTYAELRLVAPGSPPPGPAAPVPSVIYAEVGGRGPR
ncbi:leukocyte immunoglobulin-like receptor subfamily A member 3 isoform X4 [Struthio camelus]|uniref:leukocyte immunoglobulin-like receptor subfamily A member 3 isoform X4 n=1 Tax=Struthio camelus TaxID=8801 RepID=UPI0036041AE1